MLRKHKNSKWLVWLSIFLYYKNLFENVFTSFYSHKNYGYILRKTF